MVKLASGEYGVEHLALGQYSTDERDDFCAHVGRKDQAETSGRGGCHQLTEIEPGSAGVDQYHAWIKLLGANNLPGDAERHTGDKETRADPYSAQVNHGHVWLLADTPADPWHKPWNEEHRVFPRSQYKDIIDGASHGFSWLNRHGTAIMESSPRREPARMYQRR